MPLSAHERERFLEHRQWAARIAASWCERRSMAWNVDDAIQDGMVGLADAVKKYDPESAWAFRTYAYLRVVGEVIEGIRSRDKQTRIERQQTQDGDRDWRSASGRRIAFTEVSFDAVLNPGGESDPFTLHDLIAGDCEDPAEVVDREEALREALQGVERAMATLPERERLAFYLYHYEGVGQETIGREFLGGVSGSRVSQLLSVAAERIRAQFLVAAA